MGPDDPYIGTWLFVWRLGGVVLLALVLVWVLLEPLPPEVVRLFAYIHTAF